MRTKVHSDFVGFGALVLIVIGVKTVLSSGLPAPHNVFVTCDSYGVVLDWSASGLRSEADFLLELVPDYGEIIKIITGGLRCNLSDHLQNMPFNRYYVTVRARDGTEESEAAQSEIFSYNDHATADITCYLDFPGVHLSPGENQLLISFINPLYLYRHTPALRNLTTSRGLRYHVTSRHIGTNRSEVEFTCLPKSYTCESGVSFPEELEEYCITLSGNIELIPVRKTNPVCYRGRLMPSPSATVYLIPVIVFSAMGCAVLFLHFFLLMKFKKKSLAKFPKFLVWQENTLMKHTNTLKIETEPVVTNPKVEPDVAISLQYDSPEISALLRLLANSTQPSDNSSSLTSEENMGMDSGSGDPDENYSREAASSLSLAYDCPHRLVEMSTGDVVDAYGPRSHYRQ
ncbi:interferon gamma receptor 1 [Electrophorus electricus]|uniref:interferon gamma receptor 1 n=1 Tax=Electrophorus electricus TaxID=8005 RepID=UPI0015D09B9A|nr:interferon gamma receptor 1 [Electrophorus electricus]